jgi:hypothetical protein
MDGADYRPCMKAGEGMTDGEKKKYRDELLEKCMKYNHIDYDDDKDIIEDMLGAAEEILTDLIEGFDLYHLTFRQKILIYIFVKELYDHKEAYEKDRKGMTNAVSTMLLQEKYGGMK